MPRHSTSRLPSPARSSTLTARAKSCTAPSTCHAQGSGAQGRWGGVWSRRAPAADCCCWTMGCGLRAARLSLLRLILACRPPPPPSTAPCTTHRALVPAAVLAHCPVFLRVHAPHARCIYKVVPAENTVGLHLGPPGQQVLHAAAVVVPRICSVAMWGWGWEGAASAQAWAQAGAGAGCSSASAHPLLLSAHLCTPSPGSRPAGRQAGSTGAWQQLKRLAGEAARPRASSPAASPALHSLQGSRHAGTHRDQAGRLAGIHAQEGRAVGEALQPLPRQRQVGLHRAAGGTSGTSGSSGSSQQAASSTWRKLAERPRPHSALNQFCTSC